MGETILRGGRMPGRKTEHECIEILREILMNSCRRSTGASAKISKETVERMIELTGFKWDDQDSPAAEEIGRKTTPLGHYELKALEDKQRDVTRRVGYYG